MFIKEIKIENFRNIENLKMMPSENVNVIFGKNAQGKTNILEAIWLFCGAKSFRTYKEQEFIKLSSEYFKNEMIFFDGERDNNIKISLSQKKEVLYNGVKKKSAAEIAGNFTAVAFIPTDLMFIKGGPEIRRRFLDGVICQIKPSYISLLHKYNKILSQRNALLKDAYYNADIYDLLDVYDREMAKTGTKIINERKNYLYKLNEKASSFYDGISGGKEKMRCFYISSADDENEFYEKLKEKRREDIKQGFSSIGPQRDDIEVLIDEMSAKNYASQGQQRSIILTLKLAEGEIIYKETGKKPIFLLDDVMSELDEYRQDFILNHVKENQVFITCCDISSVLRLFSGKIFEIKEGKIVYQEDK
ncbi:MAG: DNA replication/repair protein RecF [Oscillospiraceae bacterium]|nr:DNA replication/repair protein RecF [Oscillospiraceae bacterium]